MMYELVIIGDSNDGDYIHNISIVSQDIIDFITPIAKMIANFKPAPSRRYNGGIDPHNWRMSDWASELKDVYPLLTMEDISGFMEFAPSDVHTISKIYYSTLTEKTILLSQHVGMLSIPSMMDNNV